MFFHAEVTDTFGGEANYSWCTRYKVEARTMRGAVNKLAKHLGAGWRCAGDYGDQKRYNSSSGATCFFIEEFDIETHGLQNFTEI